MALDGRVALVSGGGRGVGRAVSLGLAEDGADIAVNYRRDEAAAAETVEAIRKRGRRAVAYRASVDSWEDDQAMVEAAVADLGPIDILVNNAGQASRGYSVADTDPDEFGRLVGTHAFGGAYLSKLVLPGMRTKPRGDIIMISSVTTKNLPGWSAPYNMGKAAQEALAMTLAKEEQRNNIRVNVIQPGLIETEMGRRLVKGAMGVEDIRTMEERMPFQHICQPEDVAALVRFLVSDDGGYISVQCIGLDGGGMPPRR
jgi:NAD(P)-dependent dehydrogenase (short-subunit alcohol dehydrogenase family)